MKNFKCYNEKKQRLAIFGRADKGLLEIFILRCSVTDQFSKKFAIETYQEYLNNRKTTTTHPEIKFINIEKGNTPEYTFKLYCRDNFYKESSRTIARRFYQKVLIKEGKEPLVVKSKLILKGFA